MANLNATIPKLINDKLMLEGEVKEEKQRVTFLRHEIAGYKKKHLAEIDQLQRKHNKEEDRLEQKRLDMSKMYEAEILQYFRVIEGKERRVNVLVQTIRKALQMMQHPRLM